MFLCANLGEICWALKMLKAGLRVKLDFCIRVRAKGRGCIISKGVLTKIVQMCVYERA